MGELQTTFNFVLPKGLVDIDGKVHRQGVMRLATAKDELSLQKDHRIRQEPVYGVLIMLSRVIVSLGELSSVTPENLENLFTRDLAYLREFYNRINQQGNAEIPVQCPQCGHNFREELVLSGES
ncbi:MAG: phage tail assembly protein [Cyanobacteria bacterium J06639_18]